jgi:hypothetical protein
MSLLLEVDWEWGVKTVARYSAKTLAVARYSAKTLASQAKSIQIPTVRPSSHLGLRHPSRAHDQDFIIFRHCLFVDMGCSVCVQNGSLVDSGWWASSEQSFSGLSPMWFAAIFYSLRCHIPQTWGPDPRIRIPQEVVGPLISPVIGLPFHGLLWIATLRWKY